MAENVHKRALLLFLFLFSVKKTFNHWDDEIAFFGVGFQGCNLPDVFAVPTGNDG
jgi:hypothetical protein